MVITSLNDQLVQAENALSQAQAQLFAAKQDLAAAQEDTRLLEWWFLHSPQVYYHMQGVRRLNGVIPIAVYGGGQRLSELVPITDFRDALREVMQREEAK